MTAPADGFANWQPIETAPQDGTRILTFRSTFGESMAVAWYHVHFGWVPVNGQSWPEPTHWQPLPPPPSFTPPGERAESK